MMLRPSPEMSQTAQIKALHGAPLDHAGAILRAGEGDLQTTTGPPARG